MKARYAVLVAIVAAVTLTSVAAAGLDSATQRAAIVMTNLPDGKFALTPLQLGAVKTDSGTTSVSLSGPKVAMRDGQQIEIWTNTWTLAGKRGSLTIRERVEWIDAGGPFIGTGTWKLVRGTGAYARIAAAGRSASAGLNRANGAWFVRYEGYFSAR